MSDEPLLEQVRKLWAGAHEETPIGRLIAAVALGETPDDLSVGTFDEIVAYLSVNSVATWDAISLLAERLDAAN